jgi:hypothetical protein
MVAYSFNRIFVPHIEARTKLQTVRPDRKRHAREGEIVQLYTGMRTRYCRLIGEPTCASVAPITLDFETDRVMVGGSVYQTADNLEWFAHIDGFPSWRFLCEFWAVNHPGVPIFSGVMIRWYWPSDKSNTPLDGQTGES